MKVVSKLIVVSVLVAASVSGFAAGAPEISSGATVSVSNNKAKRIVSVGADVAVKALKGLGTETSVDAIGDTNVNSLVVSNGGKIGGTVTIDGNEAEDVYHAGGGTVNVNSVVLK